mmetsp:Transcript_5450/g.12088  ORF Transcript_5450/g.12088 Transcript_5450/m.12088 type:complete len:210 (-) Transcript_5450:68-697(-)
MHHLLLHCPVVIESKLSFRRVHQWQVSIHHSTWQLFWVTYWQPMPIYHESCDVQWHVQIVSNVHSIHPNDIHVYMSKTVYRQPYTYPTKTTSRHVHIKYSVHHQTTFHRSWPIHSNHNDRQKPIHHWQRHWNVPVIQPPWYSHSRKGQSMCHTSHHRSYPFWWFVPTTMSFVHCTERLVLVPFHSESTVIRPPRCYRLPIMPNYYPHRP